MLERARGGGGNAISRLFSTEAIAPGHARPFLKDGEGNGYEALLTARNNGSGTWYATRAEYKDAFSRKTLTVTE
jgi:hypothetical protein